MGLVVSTLCSGADTDCARQACSYRSCIRGLRSVGPCAVNSGAWQENKGVHEAAESLYGCFP